MNKTINKHEQGKHRRDSSTPIVNLGFEDPEVALHYEKLKVQDLEKELGQLLDQKDKMAELVKKNEDAMTEIKQKVKEATSNENWGTSTTVKNSIAEATNDDQSFREIMSLLWQRMKEKKSNWRIVYKSVDLLLYLIKNGHERVIEEARDHQTIDIKPLMDFHYFDPDTGADKGRGIRTTARQIMDLLKDNPSEVQ